MRIFIALKIPEIVKKEAKIIQLKLKKSGFQAIWVKPSNLHLTLAFLGSVKPEAVKPLNQILAKSASRIEPVKLHLSKLDAFPGSAEARVIFLDLGGEKEKLRALASKIREQLKKESFRFDEKNFQAHLTLGRMKKKKDITRMIRRIRIKKKRFELETISLIKSQLTPTGPVYTSLKSFPLGPNSEIGSSHPVQPVKIIL